MRGWIGQAVLRPVTTMMVTITVLLFGLVAALRLPVELLPELSYPTITVRTSDSDAAPLEVEELITRPIEERVGAVPGVVKVESVSREGQSDVVLDFAWGTPMDQAIADVREKLDRVTLPTTADRPLLLRYDPSQEPIMRLALRPNEDAELTLRDLAALRKLAEDVVKRELEKIAGVAAVQIHGGELEEVAIELDPARLAALGVGADDVVTALQRDNVNRPGGAVDERDDRYLVRTLHEAETPEQLGAIIVRSSAGRELRIRDLAKVQRRPLEREELSLVGGRESVELAVYREGDANLVAVARAIEEARARLRLPQGYEVVVLADNSQFIESSVDEVVDNTTIGAMLAVLVLLFFLRELRSTVVIAVAIPISLLATFVPLQALGVSLNIMSLGGLALGVGMLVDNSIVVLEAIARIREEREAAGTARGAVARREIAIAGTAEVGTSVVASTLTTIAVFLPMAFVEGVAGQLVRDLSLAISFSILSSMLVSLTLVPVLLSFGDDDDDIVEGGRRTLLGLLVIPLALFYRLVALAVRGAGALLGLLARPLTTVWDGLERSYPWLLRRAMRRPGVVVLAALAICVVTVPLADRHGRTLVPELSQREFFVQLELPQGTTLARTEATVRRLGAVLDDDAAVELHFARVGSLTQAGNAGGTVTGTHLGQIDVRLTALADGEQAAAIETRLLARLRGALDHGQATLRLGHPTLVAFGPPIEVQVFSEDPPRGIAVTKALLPELQAIDGLPEVVADDLEGRPEVRVQFDRERLGRIGLTVDDAATAVQRAIAGEVATQLHTADRQLDVRVRLPLADRSSVEDVAAIQVAVIGGVPVRLDAVADVSPDRGPSEIRRIDGRRGLRIRARVEGLNLGGVARDVENVLAAHADDDPTVSAAIAGQAGEMEASLQSIGFTAALSLFLVYVVMAATFESLLHPFLILFTVPLAITGVAVGCDLAGLPLSAMVGIGVIVLGGIVVNNAIVLVAAINDRRGDGMPLFEAVIDAGRVRLRPILMTTLTSVLGLVPMALGLGDGASLRQPLAVSIMGGLSSSTLLTLVVIPAVYLLLPGKVRAAWSTTRSSDAEAD
ncbi:MAG: efflux RND transporter permease subunit [Deltaproteobacteria bacterium]|nr:efflux RND transporter permease subunit [Deltaproteobacteria bacterium]MBK8715990.1 efflux RND transporter permease subunit [Deltaproteobacteria bacterium]MBP7289905.1 efflux RND transporter permease subunit [Nannocystaceae bacterium]